MKQFLKSRQQLIAANIKQTRIDKNLAPNFVAADMKMSPDDYNKLELGQTEFTLTCLFKIAAILDVNILELIEHDPLLIQIVDNGHASENPYA